MKSTFAFYFLLLDASLPALVCAGQWVTNETGLIVFNQHVLPDETFTWSGGNKNGYAHGLGILLWFSNNIEIARFKGSLSNGWESGQGALTTFDGTHGEGLWVKGSREGRWTITWTNGTSYYGDVKANQRTGMGREVVGGSYTYEGEFVDGRFCGHGTQIFTDGTRYDGEFLDGMMNGLGDFRYANGIRYQGHFSSNTVHGLGRVTYPNGKILSGIWKNRRLVKQMPVEDADILYKNSIDNISIQATPDGEPDG